MWGRTELEARAEGFGDGAGGARTAASAPDASSRSDVGAIDEPAGNWARSPDAAGVMSLAGDGSSAIGPAVAEGTLSGRGSGSEEAAAAARAALAFPRPGAPRNATEETATPARATAPATARQGARGSRGARKDRT